VPGTLPDENATFEFRFLACGNTCRTLRNRINAVRGDNLLKDQDANHEKRMIST
jgi:hypothetical protein